MRYNISIFIFLLFSSWVSAQNTPKVFTSVDELVRFAVDNSVDIDNNQIRIDQAKKDRLAALIGTIEVTGSLLSAQFTDNTNLGVSLFPAEMFGGTPGDFQEVEMGVKYNTNVSNQLDIKLYNPNGYNNLKLADINIELTDANNRISLKQYQESLVSSYFNIINIQKQIENTKQSIATSDSLLTIVNHKYEEGLVKQQDVNDTQVNHLKLKESHRQLEYLLEQYYLSLKQLCDIEEKVEVTIAEKTIQKQYEVMPSVLLNDLGIKQSMLQERYALQNFKSAKQSFLPTVSLQLSNSWNLYNTEFKPVSGNWINSNYIGLRLNVPVPNSKQFSNHINAKFEYEIAANKIVQERNKAKIEVQTLQSEFRQAQSQIVSNKQILRIQKDTYHKNRNLYQEGIIGLDVTIQSLNAVLAAEYDLSSSQVNLTLIEANININNNLH